MLLKCKTRAAPAEPFRSSAGDLLRLPSQQKSLDVSQPLATSNWPSETVDARTGEWSQGHADQAAGWSAAEGAACTRPRAINKRANWRSVNRKGARTVGCRPNWYDSSYEAALMIELASEDTALVASITTSFSPVLHRAAATTSVSYVVRVESDARVLQALVESTRRQARTVPNVVRQMTRSTGRLRTEPAGQREGS